MLNLIANTVNYILTFKPYVLLPIFLLILSIIFKVKFKKAIFASFNIGIGFIGVSMVIGYFIDNIGFVVSEIVKNTGLNLKILDVGWASLATLAWSFKLTPIILILVLLVNLILFRLKLTNTINIDIWNYWHFIFTGAIVFQTTNSIALSLVSALVISVIVLKIGDISAHKIQKFTGVEGITFATTTGCQYYPLADVLDKLFDKIPIIRDIKLDVEGIKKRVGSFGDPMYVSFIIGIIIGIAAKLEIKKILEIGLSFSAFTILLPIVCKILADGVIIVSHSMKEYFLNKYKDRTEINITIDQAMACGSPAILLTYLLLLPIYLILAIVLPGINFIPLGDIGGPLGATVLITIAVNGNIFRSFIIAIPVIIGQFYIANYMSPIYTQMAIESKDVIGHIKGPITASTDGGHILRFAITKSFEGNLPAIIITIAVIALVSLYYKKWDGS